MISKGAVEGVNHETAPNESSVEGRLATLEKELKEQKKFNDKLVLMLRLIGDDLDDWLREYDNEYREFLRQLGWGDDDIDQEIYGEYSTKSLRMIKDRIRENYASRRYW